MSLNLENQTVIGLCTTLPSLLQGVDPLHLAVSSTLQAKGQHTASLENTVSLSQMMDTHSDNDTVDTNSFKKQPNYCVPVESRTPLQHLHRHSLGNSIWPNRYSDHSGQLQSQNRKDATNDSGGDPDHFADDAEYAPQHPGKCVPLEHLIFSHLWYPIWPIAEIRGLL
ncbi:hypothetical protein ARMSODRAFT_973830 [Armillaria solidipes]|uniref:Uncharacterized protein n=1 Tax=Armillaria solidipes TaxID=1076256 RepID=A0A2H3C5K4_9AGAR|nr:hypothetical protein ARMSODRAFT_973830 [Armillaria solidipes]